MFNQQELSCALPDCAEIW